MRNGTTSLQSHRVILSDPVGTVRVFDWEDMVEAVEGRDWLIRPLACCTILPVLESFLTALWVQMYSDVLKTLPLHCSHGYGSNYKFELTFLRTLYTADARPDISLLNKS